MFVKIASHNFIFPAKNPWVNLNPIWDYPLKCSSKYMQIIILASLHLVRISMESANDHCPQESARMCQWMKCPLSYISSQQISPTSRDISNEWKRLCGPWDRCSPFQMGQSLLRIHRLGTHGNVWPDLLRQKSHFPGNEIFFNVGH